MTPRPTGCLHGAIAALCVFFTAPGVAFAEVTSLQSKGELHVVKFDVSPALRNIPPIPVPHVLAHWGGLMVDPPGTDGEPIYGPQSRDEIVQREAPEGSIPPPVVSFDSMPNISGVAPPDPVGDIGPDHYVAMSNLSFEVYDRTGNSVFGPAANNTLWSGFGGECASQNAGDPIVLYDQFADRWLLTQFTSSSDDTGEFHNCVALSQTSDPTGPWYRWQVANNGLFPDYPKYGVGADAYYISTRDFGPRYEGIGAYAMNRAEMITGDPNPGVIYVFVDRTVDELVGDGLLPVDIDGYELPPVNSPHYYVGTMDDGGPYTAPQDAITVWEFVVDFDTPANSSFTLTSTIPMAPYDTIFPCGGGRACIPQPSTANRVDHQGYRQRPLHRAAYRNFGTHESIVTNQSVEADTDMSGIRWWEIRSPGAAPFIHQEGTFAPGTTDGIHRWFGSIAQDSSANMALGYSASSSTTFPSVWYSGRLSNDPLGTLPRGEGVIVNGTGSQTNAERWGDYSSMNIDPTDDCTFWYVNEYVPVTSAASWQLRVGAFRFEECGDPQFWITIDASTTASVCVGEEATYDLNVRPIAGFDNAISLVAHGHPSGTSATFDVNPVTSLPGSPTLTIDNTAGATAGDFDIEITGMATGAEGRIANVQLTVWDALPTTPSLTTPADMAIDQPLTPTFEWAGTNVEEFVLEVASDPGFGNIVFTETTSETSATPLDPLANSTTYYWRVRGLNACGPSSDSPVFSFTTEPLPGDCPVGQPEVIVHAFDFETGTQGWTSGSNVGPNTWALSGANPNSGAQHWHVDDVSSASDQFLASPPMAIPEGLDSLTFRFFNFQNFQTPPLPECWDGGMLEVSINGGGAFSEVVDGDLLTDPYDGPLRNTTNNPLGGRDAWCSASQPYTDSRVDISALAGEDDVVFRFRVGTDSSVGAPGWDIDDVAVVGCSSVLEFQDGFESPDP